MFNIGRTISEDPPAILGIPNLIPIEILLIFNESESLKLSSSRSDCALNDIEKNSPTKFNLPKNQTEASEYIAKKTYSKYTNEETNPFKYKVLQNISSGLVKTQRGIDSYIRPAAKLLEDSAPEIASRLEKMDYNILTKNNRNANALMDSIDSIGGGNSVRFFS